MKILVLAAIAASALIGPAHAQEADNARPYTPPTFDEFFAKCDWDFPSPACSYDKNMMISNCIDIAHNERDLHNLFIGAQCYALGDWDIWHGTYLAHYAATRACSERFHGVNLDINGNRQAMNDCFDNLPEIYQTEKERREAEGANSEPEGPENGVAEETRPTIAKDDGLSYLREPPTPGTEGD